MFKRQRIFREVSKVEKGTYRQFKSSIPKSFLPTLRDIWKQSNKMRKELSGIIPINIDKKDISFKDVKVRETGTRGEVGITLKKKMKYSISFHTHPSPPNVTIDENKHIFTTPSEQDFAFYLSTYPSTQVNLILDQSGVWVFDVDAKKAGGVTYDTVIDTYRDVLSILRKSQLISREKNETSGKYNNWLFFVDTDETIKEFVREFRRVFNDMGMNINYVPFHRPKDINIEIDIWTEQNILSPKIRSPNKTSPNFRKVGINRMNTTPSPKRRTPGTPMNTTPSPKRRTPGTSMNID